MTRITLRQTGSEGFTLMEVIVTLIIAAILASMLFTFMRTGIIRSVEPINMLKEQNFNSEVMEKIVGDYKAQMKEPDFDLNSFSTYITETYGSQLDGITITQKFVLYNESDVDGVYDESLCVAGCKNLKITLTTGLQSITALFTE